MYKDVKSMLRVGDVFRKEFCVEVGVALSLARYSLTLCKGFYPVNSAQAVRGSRCTQMTR